MKSRVVVILLILMTLPTLAFGAVVLRDGFVIRSSGSAEISGPGIRAVAVQPWNAKIIIGGEFTITGGDPAVTRTNLARLNPDGTLDASFNPPAPDGPVSAIAIQPDQAHPDLSLILVGGNFGQDGLGIPKGLARFNSADGSLDGSFDPVSTDKPVKINAIVLQPDGKSILVGGSFAEIALGVPSRNLARITVANPDLEAVNWSYSAGIDGEVNAILLQNGSILVGGNFQDPGSLLVRLTGNGGPDAGFEDNFITDAPGGTVKSLALQADGKILIGGDFEASWSGTPTRTYLARLNRNGSHDTEFKPEPNSYVASIVVLPDGKILVAGGFTGFGAVPVTRNRLARLDISGSPDSAFTADLDAAVNVILRQPDGKLLAGGEFANAGGEPRTRLARFYPQGGLDDDVSTAGLSLDGIVTAVSLHADGTTTIAGQFDHVQTKERGRIARLEENWDLVADADFDPHLTLDLTPNVLVPLGDGGLLMGGNFLNINGVEQKLVVGFDRSGNPSGSAGLISFNSAISSVMENPDSVQAMALPPRDTFVGTDRLAPGMVYVGGNLSSVPSPFMYLSRFKKDGTRDPGFSPSPVTDPVFSMAIHPDSKLLVGTSEGKILRLDVNGNLDLDLTPTPLGPFVSSIALQPDKRVIVSGLFSSPTQDGQWQRNILRFNSDGTLDEDFKIEGWFNGDFPSGIMRVAMQTDGSMLIYGSFNEVKDATGARFVRDNVARITPDGKLDQEFDLGPFTYESESPLDNVSTVNLQPDGKIVIGGSFLSLNGGTQSRLVRVSNGWAAEELSVSADGSKITWLRSGTGPELSSVLFEYSDDPDAPEWTPLGDAARIEGGWQLVLVDKNLGEAYGYNANRYVRARGYAAGDKGGAGSLIESVRLYYLEPEKTVITVQADAKRITYGDAEPELTYTWSPALSDGDSFTGSLSRLGNGNAGTHLIQQGTLALNGKYSIDFRGADLIIDPKPVTVNAQQKEKAFGDADPALTYTSIPATLVGTDSFSGALGRVAGEEVGVHAITQGTLALGGNYALSFSPANLTITAKTITVNADPKTKGYGDADPAFTFTSSPALVGTDSFSGTLGRVAGEDVGDHAITQGTLALGGNYALAFNPANLAVTAKTITVNADPKTKSYGDADPALTYTSSPALVGSDSFSGLLQRTAGETVAGSPYAIQQGTLALNGNYAITFQSAQFSISTKGATVSAVSAIKTYGAADPALSTANSGFLPGDLAPVKITFGAGRDPGENAGSYLVRPTASDNGTGLLGNYTVLYQNGNVTIIKAPLVITAENKSKQVGEPNPELTASFDGLANFDSLASLGGVPLLATIADAESAKGSYPIVASIGSIVSANYDYSFVNGVLTVTGSAPQSITFDPLRPKTFGDGDFDPGATASSGLTVEYDTSAPGIAAVVGRKIRVLAPGSADLTASQGGDEQYAAAPDVMRTLTVNPPPWNGLGLDGVDDAMRLEDAPQLNFGAKAGFTVETWLHLDGSQPDGTGLVAKANGAGNWSGYQLILHRDRIAAEIADGTVSFGVPQGLVGSTSLNDGQWHHVALAIDRAQATAALYLDGRLEAQLADPAIGLNPDNSEPLLVGTDRSGFRFFKGEIDETRLWDGARSKEQIRAAVSQIVDPLDEPQLAAYFHLDEGDVGLDNTLFPRAPERTAHAADGILQGFALSGAASNWIRSGAFLPLLETAAVSSTSPDAATGGGLVYPNYYPATDVGLCWGTAPGPGLADSCSHSGSGTGPFAGALTGLTPGATYHVRAFATNRIGTAYGNEVSFQSAREQQSIEIATITDRTYGDAGFYPGGTATSGLPITYASSNPEVAIVVNGEIQITGAGSTVITASQGGDQSYRPAPDVSVPFTVAKAPLWVTAEAKSRPYLTPNPALTVTYRGFVNGEQLSVLSGVPLLTTAASLASEAGNYDIALGLGSLTAANYYFVLTKGTLSVFKSCQEITFPPIAERTFGDAPFEIVASACSGLDLSFTSSNPEVARVSGNILTITGAGSVVITASQGGNGDLDRAPDRSQTFIVHKSGQGVSFSSLAQKVLGDPPFGLTATATSGLPVRYLSSDPGVAVISGSTVTLVGAGTTVISALQPGDGNYNAALPAAQPLTVAEEGTPPLVSLSTLHSGAVTSNPVLNIMGRATDASGIASLTVNGADLSGQAALFSSAVPLSDGVNSISVTARDGAGNRTTQTLSITLDALAPIITVGEPADNSVTDDAIFTVSGSVTPGSTVTLGTNGGSLQILNVADGRFTGTGYLQEGVNTVALSAQLPGRSSWIKRSVTLAPGRPGLAITEPVQDLRTEQQSMMIHGMAGALPGGSVILDVDGTIFTPELSGGSFQQQIALPRTGEIRITAMATDSGGQSSIARRNIIRIDRIMGDLNGNGSVDIQDASALLRISLGAEPATEQALAHGDLAPLVNGVPQPDGMIDVGDLLVLLRKIVGLVEF